MFNLSITYVFIYISLSLSVALIIRFVDSIEYPRTKCVSFLINYEMSLIYDDKFDEERIFRNI